MPHKNNDVILIAAVGRSGQIGMNGKLPWHNADDLEWFKGITSNHIVIVGSKTYETLPFLPNRLVWVWNRNLTPEAIIEKRNKEFPDKRLFIAGGSQTYKAWRGHYWLSFITHVDYDGPADCYMPDLWVNKNDLLKLPDYNILITGV